MAYTNSPKRPRVRMEAVRLVRRGWSTRKVARHMGFDHSSIVRWMNQTPGNRKLIQPVTSFPHAQPEVTLFVAPST